MIERVAERVVATDVPARCSDAYDRVLDVTSYTSDETLVWKLAQSALDLRAIGEDWSDAVSLYRKQHMNPRASTALIMAAYEMESAATSPRPGSTSPFRDLRN